VAVASKDEAVAVLLELLQGHGPEAMKDMLALNLGCCLHLLEDGLPLKDAVAKARAAVDTGVAAFWEGKIHA